MSRGNQREKAREANLKKQAAQAGSKPNPYTIGQFARLGASGAPQPGNTMSGTQMQNAKEKAAEIMRQKQAAGKLTSRIPYALNQGRKKKKEKMRGHAVLITSFLFLLAHEERTDETRG
ncbi:hypothetical protein SAPIO_CDS1024 [Scedosporium apiospermum]|uniref:Small EDRK-rich factor-like N-terminal domain-containing protein n=1 Tax=Pseudallescheria apiosperma TaxID=563466 RepID=A0A084GFP3_PSEDA|nr:uncharacterized protein SAPIO_CDS1024 [Scedosporium apiospermum]KEZ46155.1 hypothetical protein SAPIO_CDS1024 [Scedosporium apiospermum]